MNKRKYKKLFDKESTEWLLKKGWICCHTSHNTIKYIVRKLEKLTKLKLMYFLYIKKDYFSITSKINITKINFVV